MNKLFLILILAIFSANSTKAAPPAPILPSSWLVTNEFSEIKPISEALEKKQIAKVEENLDEIFSAQTSALEKSAKNISTDSSANNDDNYVPWRLVAMITDLGISKKGLIGLLTWKGTAGVSFYWFKKEKNKEAENFSKLSEPTTILVNDASSPAELDTQIESTIQGLMATRKIENEKELRNNFRQTVYEFAAISSQIENLKPTSSWGVSKVRMDLSIDGSGKVSFAPSFGVNVRLRLEWAVNAKNKSAKLVPEKNKINIPDMQNIMAVLNQDVKKVMSEEPKSKKFKAKTIRLALGISASKTIGLVNGTAKTVFHVYLSKKNPPLSSLNKVVAESQSPLLLIENTPSEKNLSLANSLGNLVELRKNKDSSDAIYRLDREKFRNGLKKSIEMSGIFSERAAKYEKKNWGLKRIKTNIEVSLSGAVGLTTLTGSATAEITFENINF